jgi:hypothetical protein
MRPPISSIQPGTPPRDPQPQKNSTAGLVLKLALVASLVALVVSVARFFKPKPAEAPAVVEENVSDAPVAPEPTTSRKRFSSRGLAESQPAFPRPFGWPIRSSESGASNWVAVEAPTAAKGYLVAARLPELQSRIDNVFARLEPPVFYQVPLEYEADLNNRLAEIRTATNAAKQFILELTALTLSAERDHKDYVQEAKMANAQRRAEASGAMKKVTELQGLYLERKRGFQLESARLKPQLDEPPAQFEAKLVLLQKAATAYKNDIDQLEAAIYTLQKQNQATVDSLGARDESIEKAYELSAQDVIGQLTVLSNRVQTKLSEVNETIRDYNARLTQYGSVLRSAR